MPLPATFYAKANVVSLVGIHWQSVGFGRVLGLMPLVNVASVLAVLVGVCALILVRPQTTSCGRLAVALYVSGVSSVRSRSPSCDRSIRPRSITSDTCCPHSCRSLQRCRCWHTRCCGVAHVRAGVAVGVVVIVMGAVLLASAPARYRRLSNDARNIDDVQVAFGRALATAPPAATAWVVDAGASRYFGRAFVVDLMGLNTFELLKPGAEAFLDRHPPSYLDVFPGGRRSK